MQYEWNEAKRAANLRKHGYDFADADDVYENPCKLTLPTTRSGEPGGWTLLLSRYVAGF